MRKLSASQSVKSDVLRVLRKTDSFSLKTQELALKFAELIEKDESFLEKDPSGLAGACVYIASALTDGKPVTQKKLANLSGNTRGIIQKRSHEIMGNLTIGKMLVQFSLFQ